MLKVHELYYAALEADKAFSEALVKQFGKANGDIRYQTDKQPAHIKALGIAYQAAIDDYLNEVKGNR
jgi:hypothetical protein